MRKIRSSIQGHADHLTNQSQSQRPWPAIDGGCCPSPCGPRSLGGAEVPTPHSSWGKTALDRLQDPWQSRATAAPVLGFQSPPAPPPFHSGSQYLVRGAEACSLFSCRVKKLQEACQREAMWRQASRDAGLTPRPHSSALAPASCSTPPVRGVFARAVSIWERRQTTNSRSREKRLRSWRDLPPPSFKG